MKHIGGGIDVVADPTTAAGRALLASGLRATSTSILAIEAEARAAALDEARAAVDSAMSSDGWTRKVNALAAIDALRSSDAR